MTRLFMATVIALFAAPEFAFAQSPQPAVDLPVTALKPKPEPGLLEGKVAMMEGTAPRQGHRFSVDGVNLLQLVRVTVVTRDPKTAVEIGASKVGFGTPLKKASTQGSGFAQIEFRVQGGFNLEVNAAAGAVPYQLAVWVGDEVKPRLATPFKVMPDLAKRKTGKAAGKPGGAR